MSWIISGYTYFDNKDDARKTIANKNEIVAFEPGLGWYTYNKIEYQNNPRKRMFGF